MVTSRDDDYQMRVNVGLMKSSIGRCHMCTAKRRIQMNLSEYDGLFFMW